MNVVIGSNYLWQDFAKVGLHAFGKHLFEKGHKIEWFTISFSSLLFLKPTHVATKWAKLMMAIRPQRFTSLNGGILINRTLFPPVHPVNFPFLNSYYVAKNYLNWALPSPHWILRRDSALPIDLLLFDSGGIALFYPLHRSAQLTIYRLSDFVAEFPGQVRGKAKCETEVICKTDIVLAVSQSLYEEAVKIRGTPKGVYLLPNGVDTKPFGVAWPEPPEYKEIPRPRAIYVGTMASWFDWEFLVKVAAMCPFVSFILVGRGSPPAPLPKNVYLLGAYPPERIPAFVQHADVGLIIFKDLPRIARIEKPLKFYDYLAAGLPVVSVSYGNLRKGMEPYALFGANPEEFASALKLALATSGDEDERTRRKAESTQFAWDHVFARFEAICKDNGVIV